MKILRNYILRECVPPFLLALGVLTCVFLLGNLVQLANLVINKGVSLTLIGRLFLLYVPMLLGYTLPIACLIAVILTFSRLSADNEILAIRASGVYIKRILYPLILVGLILSLLAVILNDKVIPYASHEQRKVLKNIGVKNPTAALEAGSFIKAFEGQIVFIYRIEGNKLYNVRIYQPQEDGPTRTIVAREGEFTTVPGEDKIKLKLIDGTADEPDLQNPENFYKLNFKNYFMTLDLSQKEQEVDKKPEGMTLSEIEERIDELEGLYVNTTPLWAEYHRKISWSFAILVFMLLGFPLAVITHRREKSANIVMAILCAAVYYLLSLACEAWAIQGKAPVGWTMWTPNIIAGTAALVLNYRLCTS